MDTNDPKKTAADFSSLTQDEQAGTYGGLYRGPTSPYRWIQLLLDRLKNNQD